MKKYQVIWGWNPPEYDKPKGNFRLFFASEQRAKEVSHEDIETGEVTTDTVTEWLCDVVEYNKTEAKDILRMLKENKDSVECRRWILKAKIEAYDKSANVNDFTLNGIHLWLDSTMRSKVEENLKTCEKLGEESTTLRFGGMAFPVTVEQGWQMYYAVLAYARDSWNVTESHLAMADSLATSEELDAYDYTAGYPEKLSF